jgi:hypothetical protein
MSRIAVTVLLASSLALSAGGCASMSDFTIDPGEWFAGDWFGNKKKLPGDRKPVFPEGVPGVARGIPPELMKGHQEVADLPADLPATSQAAAQEKSKQKTKAKPKPKVAAQPPDDDPRPTQVTARRPQAPVAQQPAAPQRASSQQGSQQSSQQGSQWPEPPPAQSQRSAGPQWPEPPATRGSQQQGGGGGGVQWPDPPSMR